MTELGYSDSLRIYIVRYDPIPEVLVAATSPEQARELSNPKAREYGWGIDRPATGVALYELTPDEPQILWVNDR